jgi:hypothetical protein
MHSHDLVGEGEHVIPVRHVERMGAGGSALPLDQGGGLRQPLLIDIGYGDHTPLSAQFQSERPPHARGGTRDDGDLVSQILDDRDPLRMAELEES